MLFDQRLNTEEITPELINYIVEKIVCEIQPEKITLFGSYARADFNRNSDLDLFIVKDDDKVSNKVVRRKMDTLLRGRKFAIDILVRKSKEIEWNKKARNPFYLYHIFNDGKVLYEKS